MRRLCSVLASLMFVGFLVPMIFAQEAQAQSVEIDHEFTIAVGETLTFNARGIRRVAVGDDSVADPQNTRDGRYLLITGRSPGVSTIVLFSGNEDEQRTLLIRVVGINPISLAEEVREVLGGNAGVDIRVVKGRVLIEGEVAAEIFQRKIDRLVELYPNQVLNFATYREAFVEGARMVALDIDFIQMSTVGRDNLGVNWNQFLGFNLTGGLGDVPLYYDAGELGPGVLPGQESNLPPRPMALTGGQALTTYSSLVGNLNFTLDFLTEQGLIRTVQSATLVTEAGTAVEYHSGGILLIRVAGLDRVRIEEKDFGLILRATPILDFENRVKVDFEMEYSELDFSIGTGDLPGIRVNNISATVNMMEGQSVLIASQNGAEGSSTERGFWMLSRIPILGWAFKSRTSISEEFNNAMFITPRVYEPGSDYHRTMVQGVFQELLDAGAQPDELPSLTNANGQ